MDTNYPTTYNIIHMILKCHCR